METAKRMPRAKGTSLKSSLYANAMVVAAATGLVMCLVTAVVLVILAPLNTQAGGMVISLIVSIAAMFGSCLNTAYNFEFGSSRGSADKQSQLSSITAKIVDHSVALGPVQGAVAAPDPPPSPAPAGPQPAPAGPQPAPAGPQPAPAGPQPAPPGNN
jgi:hypothetical protein